MTKSEEWEQFSAYRPMIEDAKRVERERIIAVIRDWFEADADLIEAPSNLIDLIESGDNNE